MNKIYKVVMKSKTEIPLESKESLDILIEAANSGARLVKTKFGVIDTSSIDCIVVDVKSMNRIAEQERMGIKTEQANRDVLGLPTFDDQKTLLSGKRIA
jgi:hypothetical protein